MTTTATSSSNHHLSPAFPGRAPWGTASKLRAWQQGAMEKYIQEKGYLLGTLVAYVSGYDVRPGFYRIDAASERDLLGHQQVLRAAPGQDPRPDARVHLHHLELVRGEPPRLEEDGVRDADLPHVVERRRAPKDIATRGSEPQGLREDRRSGSGSREVRHEARMIVRPWFSALNRKAVLNALR